MNQEERNDLFRKEIDRVAKKIADGATFLGDKERELIKVSFTQGAAWMYDIFMRMKGEIEKNETRKEE